MQHKYIVGHSEYHGSASVRLPHGFEHDIRFYCTEEEVLPRMVGITMLSLDSLGIPITTPDTHPMVPNYEFFPVDSRDIDAVYTLAHEKSLCIDGPHGQEWVKFPEGLDPQEIHFVGAQLPIHSSGITRLCESPESDECKSGEHNCEGILGLYKGYSLDFVSCRASSGATKIADLSSFGSGGQLGDFGEAVDYVLEILRSESKETLFDGDFARYWDGLPPGTQAVFKYNSKIFEWCELRHAYTASNGWRDAETLGKYLVTQADEGGSHVLSALLKNSLIRKHTPHKYLLQAFALEMIVSGDPDRQDAFALQFKKQSVSVRAQLLEEQRVADYVKAMSLLP
ncbi:hypothetical protein AB0N09_42650 [Streptomyces erythrochromogenes]|uniref:hypothetical protein n=1 Tax=Streptomyces erythrochromogenes TaxID=285574 RepID=UPI003439E44A